MAKLNPQASCPMGRFFWRNTRQLEKPGYNDWSSCSSFASAVRNTEKTTPYAPGRWGWRRQMQAWVPQGRDEHRGISSPKRRSCLPKEWPVAGTAASASRSSRSRSGSERGLGTAQHQYREPVQPKTRISRMNLWERLITTKSTAGGAENTRISASSTTPFQAVPPVR